MGTRGIRPSKRKGSTVSYNKNDWTELEISDILERFILSNPKYIFNNLYIFPGWESDLITVSRSLISTEVEIKTNIADFKRDFSKEKKHFALGSAMRVPVHNIPNHFYYACPEGVIPMELIPDYAGLIYVYEHGIEYIKNAPTLHHGKFDIYNPNMVDKLYYNMRSWRIKALRHINTNNDNNYSDYE